MYQRIRRAKLRNMFLEDRHFPFWRRTGKTFKLHNSECARGASASFPSLPSWFLTSPAIVVGGSAAGLFVAFVNSNGLYSESSHDFEHGFVSIARLVLCDCKTLGVGELLLPSGDRGLNPWTSPFASASIPVAVRIRSL